MFVGTIGLIFVYLYTRPKRAIPKGYRKVESVQQYIRNKNIKIERNRFSKRKIPKDIDVIVVGSGIGGLTCAALLSRVGKKVLVLEQHYIAGGTTHVFAEKGVEHETGVHYIGNIHKRNAIFNEIMDNPIQWDKMGYGKNDYEGVYDEIVIGDKTYRFRAGEENFINDLVEQFPHEEKGIREYVATVKKVSQKDLFFNMKIMRPLWLQDFLRPILCRDFYALVKEKTYDVIKRFVNDEELVSVLCGQFADYGPTPRESSFFIHASIANHYFEGGYYPRGGPGEFAKRIIPVIEKAGGTVLVAKKVEKILVEDNKAVGVVMETGHNIRAKEVVSAIGISGTYQHLLPEEYTMKHGVDKLLKNVNPSISFIYVFVNLKGTVEELKLRSSNIWVWPHGDFDKMMKDYKQDTLNNPMPMFIASGAAKDSTWGERYPGNSSAIILTTGYFEQFEQWEDENSGHRSVNYNDLKEKFAEKMLEGLYKYYPETKGRVTSYDVSTPLSISYYLNTPKGESYGLDCTPERFTDYAKILRPVTPLSNFYLTGQDVCTLGVTGAMMSGVLTAHSMLGYGTISDIYSGRNLITDLQDFDLQDFH